MDLSQFNNHQYRNSQNTIKVTLWYFINALFLKGYWFPFITPKCWLLRIFGASIGRGFVIKPNVNIKYPWNLKIGNYCWIGEDVWIDSLDKVSIASNVCISQGAYLLTGNHDYTKICFDLITEPIVLEQGVWIGAKSTVVPGTIARENSVLSVGSVSPKIMEKDMIYRGNPATAIKKRVQE